MLTFQTHLAQVSCGDCNRELSPLDVSVVKEIPADRDLSTGLKPLQLMVASTDSGKRVYSFNRWDYIHRQFKSYLEGFSALMVCSPKETTARPSFHQIWTTHSGQSPK